MSDSDETTLTHDIDWTMLEKSRYVPLSVLSTFTVRSLLYPFALVRTRLQVQVQSSIYNGTWHALTSTVRHGGFRSLYKGFLVYNGQLIPGLIYITTFEATRSHAQILTSNEYARAGLAGSFASMVAQILACPIDVISQHMQLVGLTTSSEKPPTQAADGNRSNTNSHGRQIRRIHVPKDIRNSNYLVFKHICNTLLYERTSDKPRFTLKGFYRGYFISTVLFSLTSAIWWSTYYFYQKQLLRLEVLLPSSFTVPLLLIQCVSGSLSSMTSTLLSNPLDVCRTRIQVEQEQRRVVQIMSELWQEERLRVFTKGLTARLSHSCIYSCFIIFGYETVKRVSLKEEYRERVRW